MFVVTLVLETAMFQPGIGNPLVRMHDVIGDELKEFLEPWKFDRLNTVERVLLAQRRRVTFKPSATTRSAFKPP